MSNTTTLAGILTAWEASDAFKRRSDSTKRVERRATEAIRVSRIGSLPACALSVQRTKKIVRDWLGEVATANGPRAADTRKDVLSKALNWGKREGLCAGNPAEGIADYHFSDRSDIIWTAADIAAFEAAARAARAKIRHADAPEPNEPPPVVLALLLACYTGLRCEDLCGLAWRDVGPNAITVRPLKAVRRRRTAQKKAPPPVVIPRTPELNAVLAQLRPNDEATQPWVLTNSYGRRWKPAGLSDAVGKIRDAAKIAHDDGRAKRLHDARGTFVTHMRCSGFDARDRTPDQPLTRRSLCQLSYIGALGWRRLLRWRGRRVGFDGGDDARLRVVQALDDLVDCAFARDHGVELRLDAAEQRDDRVRDGGRFLRLGERGVEFLLKGHS